MWRDVKMKGQRLLKQSCFNLVACYRNGHIHEVDLSVLLRECPLQSVSAYSLFESNPIGGVDSWIWPVELDGKSIIDESYKVENAGVQEG